MGVRREEWQIWDAGPSTYHVVLGGRIARQTKTQNK